jgi:hypothetical protein
MKSPSTIDTQKEEEHFEDIRQRLARLASPFNPTTTRLPKRRPVRSDPPPSPDANIRRTSSSMRKSRGGTHDQRRRIAEMNSFSMKLDSSSSSTSSIDLADSDSDVWKLRAAASWNDTSFFYRVLFRTLQLPRSFLALLSEHLCISNTETFLDFFNNKPLVFLSKLDDVFINKYANSLYLSWLNARFFLRLHSGESIHSFATSYDFGSPTAKPDQQLGILQSLRRFFSQSHVGPTGICRSLPCGPQATPRKCEVGAFFPRV